MALGTDTTCGFCTVTISSEAGALLVAVAGEVTVRLSGFQRELKMGASGVLGKKKMPMQGRLTIAAHKSSVTRMADFTDLDAVSVQAVAADGTTYMLNGSIVGDPPELSAVEGEFTLEFEGDCEEIV